MGDLGHGWKISGVDQTDATAPPPVDLGKGWKIGTAAAAPTTPAPAAAPPPVPDTRTGPQIQAEELDPRTNLPRTATPQLLSTQRTVAAPPQVDDRSDARKFLEDPLISSSDIDRAIPHNLADEAAHPILTAPFGIARGLLKGAAGMTSPLNAGIVAATGGLGMAAEATTAATAQAARVAQSGLSAIFATQAGKAVWDQAPEVARLWKAGDTQGALEAGGQTLINAAMAAGAVTHAAGSLRRAAEIGKIARSLQSDLNARQPAEPPQRPAGYLQAPPEPAAPPAEPRPAAALPPAPDAAKGWKVGADVFDHDPVGEAQEKWIRSQELAEIARRNPPAEPQVAAEAQPQPPEPQPQQPVTVPVPQQQTVAEKPQQANTLTPQGVPTEGTPAPEDTALLDAIAGKPFAKLSPAEKELTRTIAARLNQPVPEAHQETPAEPGQGWRAPRPEEAAPAAPSPPAERAQPAQQFGADSKARPAATAEPAAIDLGRGWSMAPAESRPAVPEPKAEAPAAQQLTPPEDRKPGWVGNVHPSELTVDAPRFQFKQDVGQGGVSDKLKDARAYNPELGGMLAVWKDPADGKTYVVNGHHRLDLANRLDAPAVSVRYLDAANAQEARLKGAVINISEDQGTSLDAAKVFRDSGKSIAQLQDDGLTIKGKIASEGLSLSKLDPAIFRDVINGDLKPARGAVLGNLANHADQANIYAAMQAREKTGDGMTDAQVAELIRMNDRAPKVVEKASDKAQASMFGDEEDIVRSLLPEKAIVSEYVRKQLGAEKKLFGLVGSQAAADKLGAAGNVIKAGDNAKVAEEANQGIVLYDKLSTHAGPIDAILDQAAQRLAAGETSGAVKQDTYRQIREHLTGEVAKLTGVRKVDIGGAEGLGKERPLQAGPGQRNQLDAPGVSRDDARAAEALPAEVKAPEPPAKPLQAAVEKHAAVVADSKAKLTPAEHNARAAELRAAAAKPKITVHPDYVAQAEESRKARDEFHRQNEAEERKQELADELEKARAENERLKTAGKPKSLVSASLRKTADAMAAQIEAKRNPAIAQQNVTRRRSDIAAGMAREADGLEVIQAKLNGLADAHDAGTIPKSLANVRTRALVEDLNTTREKFPHPFIHQAQIRDLEKLQGKPGTKAALDILHRNQRDSEGGARITSLEDIGKVRELAEKAEKAGISAGKYAKAELASASRLYGAGITPEKWTQAKADLASIGKVKPAVAAIERQIKDAERALIGQKIAGYFPTPQPVVGQMLEAADIKPGMSVLEPSAGKGNIADRIRTDSPDSKLSVIERNGDLRGVLELKKHNLVGDDFLEHNPGRDAELRADLGVSQEVLDSYNPAAGIKKLGNNWMYTTVQGNDSPLYDSKHEAVEAAGRHKELKQAQQENPTGYRDLSSVKARQHLALIKKYQDQGMSEMEAGARAVREVPEAAEGTYDRIVMNPPFENGQDVDHVQHAYKLLKPGGRIVSIMGEHPFFANDKKSVAFREWLEAHGGTDEKLPAGSFEASERSTGVAARMVTIDKPALEADSSRVPMLSGNRNEAYIPGQSTDYHSQNMVFEPHELDGTDQKRVVALVTNQSGMEYVQRLAGRPRDQGGLEHIATHLSPQHAATVANLAKIVNPSSASRQLAAAAREAAKAGKSLVIVVDHASIPEELRTTALNEELDHRIQSELRGGAARQHLSEQASKRLTESTTRGQQATTSLGHYGFTTHGEAASEIGVRLMRPGRYRELNLTLPEARSLGADYVRTLRKEYGSVPPREIARRVFDALRSPDRRGGRQSDALPGSVRPEGGRGPAGGIKPDSSIARRPTEKGAVHKRPVRGELLPETSAQEPGLFDADTERQSQVDTKRGEDKLLGDQLTAQIKSGLAAKPTKLKPAENRGLFEEERPEQGGLFDSFRLPRKPPPAGLSAKDKESGENARYWFTSRRDLWGARVNQVLENLRKVVPDPIDQEAIAIYRDFKSRPGELAQWLAGTHAAYGEVERVDHARENIEKLRKPIERAMNPTDAMKEADHALTKMAAASLAEGQRLGFIDKHVKPEEYVTHLLEREMEEKDPSFMEQAGRALGNKIGTNFPYNQQRNFPTLLDAAANNYRPRTLNAFTAFQTYGDKFATARATHMLKQQLLDSKMAIYGSPGDKNVPHGWKEIAPHAQLFRNLIGYSDAEGNPKAAQETLYTAPVIEAALRPITDPDYTSKIAGFRKLRMFQAYTKAAQLGLSFFHAVSLNYGALAGQGFRGYIKALKSIGLGPEMHEMERELIKQGGTTGIQGKIYESYSSVEPTSLPTAAQKIASLPGVRHLDQAARHISEFTFNKVQRPYKIVHYALEKAAWIAKHPHATPAEENTALRSIAKTVNALYGGIHWENIGVNKTTLEVGRAAVLAPDWTYSNYLLAQYAFEGGPKAAWSQVAKAVGLGDKVPPEWEGPPAGDMARKYWVRSMLFGIAATQAASLLISGHYSDRPTQVYLGDKDGKRIYQNMFFKGAAGDVTNLGYNIKDYGIVLGPSRTVGNKVAPVWRTLDDLRLNKDFLGRTLVPKGMNMAAGSLRGIGYAAKGMAPVPWSVSNMGTMMLEHEKYKLPLEALTTLFAGTPPSHVAEKKGADKDTLGFWDQLITGKVHATAPRGSPEEKLRREQKRLMK